MRRSMLFIPGNTPSLLMNGDILGADSVILDLEDAVSPAEKDSARILVRNVLKYLKYKGCEIIIRINPVDTTFWKDDLDALIPYKPDMIMLPKVNGAEDVLAVSKYMAEIEKSNGMKENTVKIITLLETTLGIENAFNIASADKRVTAMFLGGEDLTADLRCKRTKAGNEIFYSRSRIVMAARACGVDVYDTPFTDVEDLDGLRKDTEFAKALGFTGKASISPRHVETINEVFSPTQAEIDYAHEVLDVIEEAKKMGRGVVSLRGKMIDAPIVMRAKQVIEMEKAIFGGVVNE
ncbi:MAG: CoA ester lyase [Oscillospiraceae bacterium]